ncbi:MAG: VanZ family protein [Eubacteriales bacterium]|nr:VanZ family protein [Eubacteriales bacterium]MDD4389550.1 VanZ family protein [Eubacteriales bacterium]
MMNRYRVNKKYHYLLLFTAAVYAYLLLKIVIFKTLASPLDLFTGNHPDLRSLNMVPFDGIWLHGLSFGYNLQAIIGNIILFIPLGILLHLLFVNRKYPLLKSLGLVVASSLFIEGVQYLARIGVTDINDLILNTAGGAIGIAIAITLIKSIGATNAKKSVAILGAAIAAILLILNGLLLFAN